MKFSFSGAIAASIVLSANPVFAAWKGFNLGGTNAAGACKSTADWLADFQKIQSWPGGFNAIRLYAASDCGTLANAVPAAIQTNMKLLVGIWTEDDTHYGQEKAALLSVIQQYGTQWIAAISTGSEDLYRSSIATDPNQKIDPNTIAGKVYDVRGMVHQYNTSIQVGHTDTWTMWVDSANDVVTRACDFVITDGYPYWQGKDIASSHYYFYQSLTAVKSHIAGVHSVPVWVGETGWPTGGSNFGAAYPGVTALKRYWVAVACQMMREYQDFFWYSAFDAPTATDQYNVEKHFGVAYAGRTPKFSLAC